MATPLHIVVEMAKRRQRPGTGSRAEFLMERTAMIEWPRLEFLEPLFAVIGAVGARLYAPERTTRDLDVLLAKTDADQAASRLLAAGWGQFAELSIGGASWRSPQGRELDVFFAFEDWWPELIAEAYANRDSQGLPILPLRGQVFLKLRAGRSVDAGDLSRLLGLATEAQVQEVREFLQEHADHPRDIEDFESLVQLGRLEFGRPEP